MRRVYLDYGATTPLHPAVLEAMLPYFQEVFGNPQSLHWAGVEARRAVDGARERVARLINAEPEEIIFTSSGTEANNMAIKGVAWARRRKGNQIIISAIEHPSVLNSAKAMERAGFQVIPVSVDSYGLVDPDAVKALITPETALVSITHASNEIGTIEPIAEIAKVTREMGVPLHTDAIQAVGQIPVDVKELGVDLLSLAGHQFYGPKGSGALYIRRGTRITPFINGGIQEEGRRAGTEDVPAIVGLGKAAEIAKEEIPKRMAHLTPLRDRLIDGLLDRIDHIHLNGHPTVRLPNNVNVSVEYVEGEGVLLHLNDLGIAASSGSACISGALKASHVLTAIGVPPEVAQGTLLFTLGMENTEEDIAYLLRELPPIVERLRMMNPIYRGSGGKGNDTRAGGHRRP